MGTWTHCKTDCEVTELKSNKKDFQLPKLSEIFLQKEWALQDSNQTANITSGALYHWTRHLFWKKMKIFKI